MVDIDYYKKYQSEKIKTGLSSAVDSFQILDNKTVVVAHDDFILRIFSLDNGMFTLSLIAATFCLLITLANSLDPELNPNRWNTLESVPKRIF